MERPLLNIIALALLGGGLASAALAANFHDGVAAYERGDIAKALVAWQSAADQGDALAQFNLGALYAHGRGVKKDLSEAAKWYRKAAEQGNPLAQYYLGALYDTGDGVGKDTVEAAKWYRRAAAQDLPQAQEALNHLAK
ncbi:MAG: tetratricopeptide repeat protein [Gammaproteobacteria bacterium]